MSDISRFTLLPEECFALIAQNYSLEGLIQLAKNPNAPSAQDPMLFSHGKRHLGEDSNYALAPRPRRLQPNEKKLLRTGALQVLQEHLKVLIQNNVRLMGKPGQDEPHLILEQILQEQKKEIATLLINKNNSISAKQKTALVTADSIKSTYIGDIIAIDVLLNEVNMTLIQPRLDAYEAAPEAQPPYLGLDGLKLTRLPEESIVKLQRYPALTTLSIFGNQLTTLPESFGNLAVPNKLDLSRNKLTTLPKSFGKLVRLTRLTMQHNPLISLPESAQQILIQTNNQYLLPLLAPVPVHINKSNDSDEEISVAAAAYTPGAVWKKQGQKRKPKEENTFPQNSAADTAEKQPSNKKRLK